MFDEIDDLFPENKKKNNKHKELLGQLRELEDDTDYSQNVNTGFLPSSLLKDNKNQTKEKKPNSDISDVSMEDYSADEWFGALMNMKGRKPKNSHKGKDLFSSTGLKKKKKKKHDKDNLTDYNKEFETEIALFRNLLQDQNKFTDSLQRQYDSMTTTKSSARGVNKTMTDLIDNINNARNLSMQLVDKNVSVKKTIADLTMKQKKELGGSLDGENMADFASTYLKQMISERQSLTGINTASPEVSDYTEDELFETLSESLSGEERPEDVDKYLKYENRNVTVYTHINSEDIDDYEFLAKDEEGEIIPDYPLPNHTQLSVNRSTDIATDAYGKKYSIIWK